MTLRPVSMDFNYGSSFGERSPSAYETLLLDAIIGDATLYTRQDMVEASWSVPCSRFSITGARRSFAFPNYAAGHLGSGGSRRNAGAARAHMEAAVTPTIETVKPDRYSPRIVGAVEHHERSRSRAKRRKNILRKSCAPAP